MSNPPLKIFLPELTEAICKHFLLTAIRINLDDTAIKIAVPLYASAFSVTDTSCVRHIKQREKALMQRQP